MRGTRAGTRSRRATRKCALAGLALLALALPSGCAHTGRASQISQSMAPALDSITLAVWHLDESGGQLATDSSPRQLNGIAGTDTRTDFGRFGNGRVFGPTTESWILVPHGTPLDASHLTVEAWIDPAALGPAEDTPIAGRWTEYPGEQSWLFSIVGLSKVTRFNTASAPGYHDRLIAGGGPGRLMFAFMPVDAGTARVYFSNSQIPVDRWTHVAATFDGSVVRFYVNGHLDAQFATEGTIRPSVAPLLIGSYFDTRKLSGFSGDLKLAGRDPAAVLYAYQGMIDELRLSSEARTEFGVRP